MCVCFGWQVIKNLFLCASAHQVDVRCSFSHKTVGVGLGGCGGSAHLGLLSPDQILCYNNSCSAIKFQTFKGSSKTTRVCVHPDGELKKMSCCTKFMAPN